MEISQLNGFCAVVEAGSFSKATKKVFVSQPAITLQIKALEDELEIALLIRDKKRIRTTDAGRILYQHAKQIFEEINTAKQEIENIHGLVKGHLTIGCSDTVSMYIMNSILDRFTKKYPQIELTVRNKTSSEIIQLITDHIIEIGITILPVSNQNLHTKHIISYNEVAVCSKNYPLAKVRSVDLKTLANHRLLVLEEGTQTRSLLDQNFSKHKITPVKIMELGSVDVQKSFAQIGMGVAIVPDFAVVNENSLAVLPIKKLPKRKLGIMVKNKSFLSPAAKEFYHELEKTPFHF